MTIEIKRVLKCDMCGSHMDTTALTREEFKEALACSDGWIAMGKKHYCPECKDEALKPRLGKDQIGVLANMENTGKPWFNGCGWHWGTPSRTERIMESLVKKGYLEKIVTPETFPGTQYITLTSRQGGGNIR